MVLDAPSIDVFQLIAERKIAEAMERGEFDHLPGKGRPLRFDDDDLGGPAERLARKILKNADLPPLEVSLRRELAELKREYARTKDPAARRTILREIRWMVLRINLLRQCPVTAEATEAILDEYDERR